MDQVVQCSAASSARMYLLQLIGWVRDLHAAHQSISRAFSSLVDEFGQVFPRSRLQLYPRSRPLHGPTALYWGEIVTAKIRSGETKKVVRHLSGAFDRKWAFTIAKRSDLVDRLLDFDRRRLALNSASRIVLAAENHLRNATVRKFPTKGPHLVLPSCLDPYIAKEVPAFPVELLPSGLAPRLVYFLRSGWILAFALALAEEECTDLALEVARNPSVDGLIRLDLSERRRPSFRVSTRWIFTPTGANYLKLTDRLMRQLRLRESVRPVISLKERKRRRIEKMLKLCTSALDSILEKCEAAQVATSTGLAEAKVVLLREPVAKTSQHFSEAG